MKFFILGANGSMGRRYTAILKHLGHDVLGADLPDISHGSEFDGLVISEIGASDGVIIASPTSEHAHQVDWIMRKTWTPILCEKPLSMSRDVVEDLCNRADRHGLKLRMVNQYSFICDSTEELPTIYNYYRTGNDGLAWDCTSILALAKGDVVLGNNSPYWNCMINGQLLSLADMDGAYVAMLQDWIKDPKADTAYIRSAHEKVAAYLERNK